MDCLNNLNKRRVIPVMGGNVVSKSVLFVLCAAMLCSFTGGCKARKKSGKGKARVIKVALANPEKRHFVERIPVQGTVLPVEWASLSAKTSGTLDSLAVDEGSIVKKDDVLFEIDRKNLRNLVTVAENELAVCSSELASARINAELAGIKLRKAEWDFKRAETLHKSQAISQDSYETYDVAKKSAESEFSKANAQVAVSMAKEKKQSNNLNIAKKNLADSIIKAPFDGVITETFVEQGEFMQQGKVILKIENHKALEVNCFISSIYYNRILPGKTLARFDLDGTAAGEARVTYRSPSIEPLSRTFKIKILVPPKSRLVSGILCDVSLVLSERDGYGIKSDAIMQRNNDRKIVFVSENGVAREVEVKTGITDGDYTEILNRDDLKGLPVVVVGQTFINSGDKLSLINIGDK